MDKKKRIFLFTIGVAIVVTVIGAISYAYFTAMGQNEPLSSNLKTATLSLRFADNDNGVNAELSFGETITKKFLIENTGTAEASLSIDWVDLINTYLNGSLTYKLSYSEEESGEYIELLPSSNVPVTSEPITQTMAYEVSVPVWKTYYYNLDITLNNLPDVNQEADLNAHFSTRFNVGQSLKYRYYTLRVNPNGGTWETHTSTQEYLLKNEETKEISTPTRVGHNFDGWTLKSSTSTIENTTFTMGIDDAELVANWTPAKYTVEVNGVQQEIEYGSSISLTVPEREGYTFTGWNTTGGTIEGNTFTLTVAKNVTITPTYQINNYKYIVYHNKMNVSGSGYTLVSADTNEGEAQFNSTVTPPVKSYTGFTSPSTKSLTIKAETVYPPVQNKVDYNYSRNQYTVTTNLNGGTLPNGTSIPSKMYYEASVSLPTPTKTGYNFSKWTASSGVVSGSNFKMSNANTTLTANWAAKTFSVTFNANGGSTPTASKTVTYNSTYGTLPTPTYAGYDFLGWFTTATGGTQVTASSKVTITGNQTLFAHWKKIDSTAILASLKLTSNGVRTDFDAAATTDEGIFEMQDDYGTSYYFRGAVENNYVKYGVNASGQEMWWRIIRINGDGSLRIIYDGTQGWTNGILNNDRVAKTRLPYNTKFSDTKYAGWMYGPTDTVIGQITLSKSKEEAQSNIADSDAKKGVDTWYKENIVDTGYGANVSDTLFCNDRSIYDVTGFTGLGYGMNTTVYGACERIYYGGNSTVSNDNHPQPIFTCSQKNDAFTVNDTLKGNGALTYPVGLITADEIVAAGSGKWATNNTKYYLYKSNNYSLWSLSPFGLNGSHVNIFVIGSTGMFGATNLNNGATFAVSPVINLSTEFVRTMLGSGTITDPYRSK